MGKVEVWACYIRNQLGQNILSIHLRNIENIFFEFFLVNSKPTKVRTIHCSLTQSNLVKILNNNMNIIDSVINEVYIPGDFNIVDFNIAQRGVIDISFFDILFIYCTREVSRIRRRYKQI